MKKTIVVAALALASAAAEAQIYSCVGQPCTVESDPFPLAAVQPVACRLRDDGVLIVESPVVAAGGGAVKCQFSRTFTIGLHTLTATAIAADGAESPSSAPFVFTSSPGAPPAPVIRLVPPAIAFQPQDGGRSLQPTEKSRNGRRR